MLHIIKTQSAIEKALAYGNESDQFLLIEEAVYTVLDDLIINNNRDRFLALNADIQARGLQNRCHDDIQLIDYNDFVDLTAKHEQSITW